MAAKIYERGVTSRIAAALSDTRVIALVGPRQSGKTTLARGIVQQRPGATFATFDDETALAGAREDPRSFVSDRPGLLVIDEVQRLPELAAAIKMNVDRDQRPGRFLLTGSSDLLAVRGLADTLAGRMEIIDLSPLTQGELEGRNAGFLDKLFSGEIPKHVRSTLDKSDYLRRACAGGFPEALTRHGRRRRHDWFDSYVRTVTDREVRSIADLLHLGDLPRLMRLAAARHGSVLNVASLARDARIPERTVYRYLDVLEAVFLIRRIRAWTPNLTARESRQTKVYVLDSGLAAHLRGTSLDRLLHPETARGADGPILEGFALGELTHPLSWGEQHVDVFHFRDRDGREVDLVVEAYDGRAIGFEVKGSTTVRGDDFRGLAFLRDRLGDRFVSGVVLYTGPESLSFGDRLIALPMSMLWRPSD